MNHLLEREAREAGSDGAAAHPSAGVLQWHLSIRLPANWVDSLRACGGGLFHSPPSLLTGSPRGVPFYAQLVQGDRVVGIAMGISARCHLGMKTTHLYFPSLPALAPGPDPCDALDRLVDSLRDRGTAEVRFDSFDSGWRDTPEPWAGAMRLRKEYRVRLDAGTDELERQLGRTHRRHLRAGERAGWTLRFVEAAEADDVLAACMGRAAERAAEGSDPPAATAPLAAASRAAGPRVDGPWGLCVISAWAGQTLLAGALVGWANGRAFYVMGGSTPEGYRQSAAVWLHWRIINEFAAQGCSVYNFGGTPAAADDPTHPSHGLFRFKTGFGAEVVECRGVHRELRPLHLWAHRLPQWCAAHLPRLGLHRATGAADSSGR